jgi:hypothetical protein
MVMGYTSVIASGTIYCVMDEDGNVVGLSKLELADPEFSGPTFNLTCKMIKWGILRARARENLKRERDNDLDGMDDCS